MRYRFGGLIFGGAYTWRGLFLEFYGSFTNTYPLCSDLSDAKRYLTFEQPVPGRINTSNGMNARAGCINYIVR